MQYISFLTISQSRVVNLFLSISKMLLTKCLTIIYDYKRTKNNQKKM